MVPNLTDVRLFVYRQFAEHAHAVSADDVAEEFEVPSDAALAALRTLDDAHLLVLDGSKRRIVMAHPWAAQPMGFVVASSRQKWWGGCAWDSFAIPALIGEPCLVASHCPACEKVLALVVRPDQAPLADYVAHLPIPVRRMWDDVVLTCGNQRLFCDRTHVEASLDRSGWDEGAVLDVPTLWTLATGWYAGRLTPEYRRRTPAEAADFFDSIGLHGDFWRAQ